MTALHPALVQPDAAILALLRQVIEQGRYRGAWTVEDVHRVWCEQLAPGSRQQPAGVVQVALSERCAQVLDGICDGLTYRQIAKQMGVVETTVRDYAARAFQSLGVRDRGDAAALIAAGEVEIVVQDGRRRGA